MKKAIYLTGLVCAVSLSSISTAQSRTGTQATQQPSYQLTPSTKEITLETFSCYLKGVQMTAEGLGYFCVHKQGNAFTDYLVVSDGGNLAGGVSAGMSLLISITEANRGAKATITNRVKSADKKAQRICDLIQGPQGRRNNIQCREAISFGWNLNSAVPTDDANPSYPSIPTGDANPNGPNIPTRPARPDG